MGSVPSSNNGLSDLLQTLTNENSALQSTPSSPTAGAARENAPSIDIGASSSASDQSTTTPSSLFDVFA